MKTTLLSAITALALAASSASAQTLTVIPAALTSVEGNASSSSLSQTGAASLQVFYSEVFLRDAGIEPGAVIDGFAFRRSGGGATGPAGDTTINEYNIFLSQSFETPAELTTTFADNVVGDQIQVHESSITFPANSIPGGVTPNAYGPVIEFSTPYTYSGGSLLIEIRRSARTGSTTSFNTDSDSTVASQAGAKWLFNTTSIAATTGTFVNGAHVFQLRYGSPSACPGDFNDDGVVDLLDLLGFLGDWNANLGQNGMNLPGDFNDDDTVDLLDLLGFLSDWNANLGETCP